MLYYRCKEEREQKKEAAKIRLSFLPNPTRRYGPMYRIESERFEI